MAVDPAELGRRLRERDRSAAPAALNVIENRADREASAALLAEVSPGALGKEAPAEILGVTGPPGAGKSSLLSELVAHWRRHGRSVAVLAVDPTSKRSGGALPAFFFVRLSSCPTCWSSTRDTAFREPLQFVLTPYARPSSSR